MPAEAGIQFNLYLSGGNFPLDCLGTKEYFLIDYYSYVARKPTNITPYLLDWSMKMKFRKVPTRSFHGNFYPLAGPFLIQRNPNKTLEFPLFIDII